MHKFDNNINIGHKNFLKKFQVLENLEKSYAFNVNFAQLTWTVIRFPCFNILFKIL